MYIYFFTNIILEKFTANNLYSCVVAAVNQPQFLPITS